MSNIQINPYNFAVPAGLGSWKELDRTVLTSESNTITVSGLDSKQYLMVLTQGKTAQTNADLSFRFNGDSATNYASRQKWDGGGSDYVLTNQTHYRPLGTVQDLQFLNIDYISNQSTQEKLVIGSASDNKAAGSGTPPTREEHVAKWANTSSALNQVQALLVNGTPNFRVGSEVVVLGYDPTDVHTTTDNFWQELKSTELGSTNGTLDSGTFTAKKYLCVQVYLNANSAVEQRMRFNLDSASNYSFRFSSNGATDGTAINDSNMLIGDGGITTPSFTNMFIINNSGNEKLVLSNNIYQNTAGSGTAPSRFEANNKWSNTSSQITSIQLFNASGGVYQAGSIIKVWGHD